MARSFNKKIRNQDKRKPKPIILLIAEGHNVTESQYFKFFQHQHANYVIKVIVPGAKTDPEGMLKAIERYWNEYELSTENGDIGFVVLDLDCDETKATLIKKLANKSDRIHFVVTNPCFETWFILHFRYSTRSETGKEAIHEIRNFIPNYEKNLNVAPIISTKIDYAMGNAKRLYNYYQKLGVKWPSSERNPMTDVPVIIEAIKNRE